MSKLSAKVTADVSGFRSAMEEAQKCVDQFANSESDASKSMKKLNDVTDEQVKSFQKSINAINKNTNGTKSNKAQMTALSKEVERLKNQWNGLSDSAKKSQFGQTLSATIRQSEMRIQALNNEIRRTNQVVNKESGLGNFGGMLSKQLPLLDGMVGSVGKLGTALGAVGIAAKVMSDAFKMSEGAMDSARRTMSGLQQLYTDFVRSVRDGNLGDLLGSFARGSAVYDAEDAFGSLMANNVAAYQQLQTEIREAKEQVTAGKILPSDLFDEKNTESLVSRVKAKYEEIIDAKKKVLETQVTAISGGDSGKEDEVWKYINGSNPNQILEDMKAQREELEKRMQTLYKLKDVAGPNGMTGTRREYTDKALYNQLDAQRAMLNSIIDSETELQTIQNVNAEILKLKQEQVDAQRELDRIQKQSATLAKSQATEEKKRREDADKATNDAIKGIRKQSPRLVSSMPAKVGEIVPIKMDVQVDEAQTTIDKLELRLAMLKDKLPTGRENLNSIASLSNGMNSLYNSMKGLKDLDNPFAVFNTLVGMAQQVVAVADTMKTLGNAIKTVGEVTKTETAIEVASSATKQAAASSETASQAGLAASKTMAAHSSIPFVGVAIGAALVASLIAIIASTKNRAKRFANGGLVYSPTLFGNALVGEGATTNARNPEVIAPLDRLKNMLGDGNNNGYGSVEFRIQGRELVGIINKENRLASRR